MTRRKRVLIALRGSIRKWKLVATGEMSDRGSYNCPLCALVHRSTGCRGCVVMAYTGRPYCKDTPYEEWCEATRHTICPAASGSGLVNMRVIGGPPSVEAAWAMHACLKKIRRWYARTTPIRKGKYD